MMNWYFQLFLVWAQSPDMVNALFVLVCLWAAFGACPRKVAFTSAGLYLLLVLI